MTHSRLTCETKASPTYRYEPVSLKEDNEEVDKKLQFFQNYSGIIYAIVAGACILISDVITRRLNHYPTAELILYRVAFEIIIQLPILIQRGIVFTFWSQAPLLLLRGGLMSLNFFVRVFTIQSLPLTESLAISFSSPIVTAVLGCVFLKYRFTNVKIAALVANVIAIVLVCHFWTGYDRQRLLGIGSGFLNVLVISTANIVLKVLTLDMPTKLVVFHVNWIRFVIMLTFAEVNNGLAVPTIPKCPDSYQWYQSEPVLIFLMAIAMLGYTIFEAEAMKREIPSTVSSIRTSTALPLAIISQVIFFNNVPSVVVVVGVILVLMASLLINIDGIVEKLSPQSSLRILVSRINN